MLQETIVDKLLYHVKKLIPKSVFNFFQPAYHSLLAYAGAVYYGFPSRDMKIIGVTGTKGKSTVVFMVSKILESGGNKVAAIGSLGFKIGEKTWPNTLKMTMPGRFRLQKFLYEAKKADCKYVVLEVTSEGIKQRRHIGIQFDCAVFTNLHREHLDNHGSFENYYKAKQELFKLTKNIHVINADDEHTELFGNFSSKKKIFYGLKKGDLVPDKINLSSEGVSFELYGTFFNTHLAGEFNVINFMASLAVGAMYGFDLPSMKPILESIQSIPGRMEFIQREPFTVVVDYAHTPESLEAVYKSLKSNKLEASKLICVLGAAGGGRDKWKRPEFGKIAAKHCDEIILTNEDPYDENPEQILSEIKSGITNYELRITNILDRKQAIKKALTLAQEGDTVIITGKGSETSMAVAGGKKIPWSDREVVRQVVNFLKSQDK